MVFKALFTRDSFCFGFYQNKQDSASIANEARQLLQYLSTIRDDLTHHLDCADMVMLVIFLLVELL